MKDIIQIEPFKISVVQIVIVVFAAGVIWGGYQTLSQSVTTLNATMKKVNDTMLVLSTNRDSDKRVQSWLVDKTEQIQKSEAAIEAKLERHDADIEALKKQVY